MDRQLAIVAALGILWLGASANGREEPADAGAASERAGTTSTASAPSVAVVEWQTDLAAAQADAKKRGVLAIVIYTDADTPACEAYNDQTLARSGVRRFLADWAAVKIDVATDEGKKLLAAAKAEEPPLTQVFLPGGELLDSFVGYSPERTLLERLGHAVDYMAAVSAKEQTPELEWKAIQARLGTSTAAKVAPKLEALAKGDRLPTGVSRAKVLLALGQLDAAIAPDKADAVFQDAIKNAGDDKHVAAVALIGRARLAGAKKQYPQARSLCEEAAKTCTASPEVGQAYMLKATIEYMGVGDPTAAKATVDEFIRKYPDDPIIKSARDLQEVLKAPVIRPVTTASAPAAE